MIDFLRERVAGRLHGTRRAATRAQVPLQDVVWSLGSVSAIHKRTFDAELLIKELPPPPLTTDALITAARSLRLRIRRRETSLVQLAKWTLPCLAEFADSGPQDVQLRAEAGAPAGDDRSPAAGVPTPSRVRLVLIGQVTATHVLLFRAGTSQGSSLTHAQFAAEFAGAAYQLAPATDAVADPDAAWAPTRAFGFRWFIPELLKHRRVWRDVLIASAFIQLLALGTPVFTQVVIDKVVVHRTQSTLVVIAVGMGLFAVFSAVLSWVRQYLVLHTGNRVDAVLGAAVLEHLLKLPSRYFESRPTGVITARLRGVENIREFIASAAVPWSSTCRFY